MVCAHSIRWPDARASWEQVLTERLQQAGLDRSLSGTELSETARAVAAYLARHDRVVPDRTLTLLLARALWGQGNTDSAREMLVEPEGQGAAFADDEAWTRLPAGVPGALWWLAGRDVLRPVRYQSLGTDPAWMLDFRKSAFRAGDALELALLPACRRLAEWVAPAWDATRGGGSLLLAGIGGYPVRIRALRHTRSVLERVAGRRDWTRVPHVVLG